MMKLRNRACGLLCLILVFSLLQSASFAKDDLLLMVGASETDSDTKNVQVICDANGTLGIVKTNAIVKNSKGNVSKSKAIENAELKTVTRDTYVFFSANTKSKRIGAVRKGMIVAVEGEKGDYTVVRTASGKGYIRSSNVK